MIQIAGERVRIHETEEQHLRDLQTLWNTPARDLYSRCGLTDTYIDADEDGQRTCWEMTRPYPRS